MLRTRWPRTRLLKITPDRWSSRPLLSIDEIEDYLGDPMDPLEMKRRVAEMLRKHAHITQELEKGKQAADHRIDWLEVECDRLSLEIDADIEVDETDPHAILSEVDQQLRLARRGVDAARAFHLPNCPPYFLQDAETAERLHSHVAELEAEVKELRAQVVQLKDAAPSTSRSAIPPPPSLYTHEEVEEFCRDANIRTAELILKMMREMGVVKDDCDNVDDGSWKWASLRGKGSEEDVEDIIASSSRCWTSNLKREIRSMDSLVGLVATAKCLSVIRQSFLHHCRTPEYIHLYRVKERESLLYLQCETE
ncbi:hypothetical protein KSP39_PZI024022 [Platanthera zijinensis]|uniref:Uncharacterized protein n=1 Tax=Platanthera zijinensis TaxID=2320716 RepID=A0AAP0ASX1_9ASPA